MRRAGISGGCKVTRNVTATVACVACCRSSELSPIRARGQAPRCEEMWKRVLLPPQGGQGSTARQALLPSTS